MIYVASPYSHPDPEVRKGRYLMAMRYAMQLMVVEKVVAFSPIAYGHQFAAVFACDYDYKTWQDFNDHMLGNSTEMHVLAFPGWEESKGVMHEIAFAAERGIPQKIIPFGAAHVGF